MSPTKRNYSDPLTAYDSFNQRLFDGKLPPCLITLQRKSGARGYFSRERFASRDGSEITDEIALNPAHFGSRTSEEILSTLVHEMVHLWQFHCGEPSRSGYHNRQWADEMARVGLIASHTGAPGGRRTGQRVTHYIEAGGPFQRACAELLALGIEPRYLDQQQENSRVQKAASKTRYTCPKCNLHAWVKPNADLICANCAAPEKGENMSLAAASGCAG
jgi:predicted SprT family Zn-dependent metalloprotease